MVIVRKTRAMTMLRIWTCHSRQIRGPVERLRKNLDLRVIDDANI